MSPTLEAPTRRSDAGHQVDPRIAARRQQVATEASRVRRLRLVVVAVLIAVAGLGWVLLHSPLLAVHEVQVTPTRHLSARQLAAIAGVRTGQPVIDVDEQAARRRLLAQPWVATARVSVGWGGVAQVAVTERQAAVAVADGPGRWVLADGQGRALALVTAVPPGVVPVAGVHVVAPGAHFGDALAGALATVHDLDAGLRTRVGASGITVGGDGSLTMALRPSGVVQLCQPVALATKLGALATFFAHADDRGIAVVNACVPQSLDVTRPVGA